MPIGLLDTDYNIVSTTMGVLRLVNCDFDGFTLVVTMADDPAVIIHDVPAVLGRVMVNVEGVV